MLSGIQGLKNGADIVVKESLGNSIGVDVLMSSGSSASALGQSGKLSLMTNTDVFTGGEGDELGGDVRVLSGSSKLQ